MKKLLLISALLVMNCKSSTIMMRPEGVLDEPKVDKVENEVKETEVQSNPEIPNYVSTESVASIMNFLASDDLQGRDSGSEGIEKAANYIESMFKKNQIAPYFLSYKDTLTNFRGNAFNVVGIVPGNDEKLKSQYIIIGAHYDHIGKGKAHEGDDIANGANDNASGTTAVMELARYFAEKKTNGRSLVFALFSAEERGLLGSAHLADKLSQQGMDLYTMVNFEMIGVPFKDRAYEAFLSGYELSNMANKINEYVKNNLIGFSEVSKKYSLFKRSDNYPFYEKFGLPCHTISSCDLTNFDYYHHVDDENDKMNFEFMASLINKMIPAIDVMSNTPLKEIKMNE